LVELLCDLSGLADLLHDHEAIVIGDDPNRSVFIDVMAGGVDEPARVRPNVLVLPVRQTARQLVSAHSHKARRRPATAHSFPFSLIVSFAFRKSPLLWATRSGAGFEVSVLPPRRRP